MLDKDIIDRITRWLEKHVDIEMKYRKIQKNYPNKGPELFSQNILYELWQEEAQTDTFPLILIDYENKVELYLVNSYIEEECFFSGYLICEINDTLIITSDNLVPIEDEMDLWGRSIGLPTPNEIIPYELAEQLDLIDDEDALDTEDTEDEIFDTYVKFRYIDFFLSALNHSYYSGSIPITDINEENLSYEEFLDLLIDETKVSFPMYEEREDIDDTFNLYYYKENALIPLTKEKFFSVIEQIEVIVFYTEDKEDALKLYHQMLDRIEKEEFEIEKNLELHQNYIDSLGKSNKNE